IVNFGLRRGTGPAGVVRGSDGKPLAGADVVLVDPSQPFVINNGRPPTRSAQQVDRRFVETGADGRYAFRPQEPPYTIVALHDRGFAEQTIRDANAPPPADLTLRPWGRIEGTLRIGRRPGADETVVLN